MFTIFKRLWKVNWAEQWQYRANLIMYLLYFLVSPVIYLAVWTSIATSRGEVNGFTTNDFITYYMTLLIVDQITSNIILHIFAYKVQDGSLSGELIRPIHPMLTNTLVNNVAFKALSLMGLIPIWILLYALFQQDYSEVTRLNLVLSIPVMALGFIVGFLLSAAVTSLAFWTTRVYSISEFYFAIFLLFSGQFVPLPLMPDFVQKIAQYLPFQLSLYFPIQLILGKLSTAEILRGFLVGMLWLPVSILLFQWVWHEGVRRYSAVGA